MKNVIKLNKRLILNFGWKNFTGLQILKNIHVNIKKLIRLFIISNNK